MWTLETHEPYEIAVHYPEDNDYGVVFVTVRLFIANGLAYLERDVRMEKNDLWHVAIVDTDAPYIELRDTDRGPLITPGYAVDEESSTQ